MRIFDLHQDLLYEIIKNKENVEILKNYKDFGFKNFIFAIFPFRNFYNHIDVENPLLFILRGIDSAYEIAEKFSLKIIKDEKDLENDGFIISVEGLYGIESVSEIRNLSRLGVKSIGLVWNKDNPICSCWLSSKDYGLSDFGYEVIKTALNMGIVIDLSHSSDKTFFDTIENFRTNIFVSHTGIRELNNIKRNLDEDMIYEITKRKGIVGIAIGDIFLGKRNLKEIVNHISKIIEKYPNSICLGSDLYGISKENAIDGIYYPYEFKNFYLKLKENIGDELTDKFFYLNAFNFFKRSLSSFRTELIKIINEIKLHSQKYNWVGIYFYKDGVLEVFDYYIGKETPHTKIPTNKGICGAAFREGKTLIVNDVSKDDRYLSCSIETKSEIVVPIYNKNSEIIGEIDIDSNDLNAFNDEDKIYLENISKKISHLL
jgi:L-methionine (R)-S-oxide reductase